MIIDKNFQIKDSMIVYKGTEYDYDYDITGLLNVNTRKMFIIEGNHGYLYKVDLKKYIFKKESEIEIINMGRDDLSKLLDLLQWKEYFMN
jgi:hypothetical protein